MKEAEWGFILITIGFEKQKPIIQSFLLIYLDLFKRIYQAEPDLPWRDWFRASCEAASSLSGKFHLGSWLGGGAKRPLSWESPAEGASFLPLTEAPVCGWCRKAWGSGLAAGLSVHGKDSGSSPHSAPKPAWPWPLWSQFLHLQNENTSFCSV